MSTAHTARALETVEHDQGRSLSKIELELRNDLADLATLARAYTNAVFLFAVERAMYDAERTDENAQLVSIASCRQVDCLEKLEAAIDAARAKGAQP